MSRAKSQDNNAQKKLYCFYQYAIIDGWTKARCVQLHKSVGCKPTESQLVEEILLREILPVHPYARKLVMQKLFTDGGVKAVLLDVFEKSKCGINAPNNLLALAEFARQQEMEAPAVLTDEEGALLPEMLAVPTMLAEMFRTIVGELDSRKEDAEFYTLLLDNLEVHPESTLLLNFYNIIIKHWDSISNRLKFNAMVLLINISNRWNDAPLYPEKRADLLDVLETVSAKWSQDAFSV